MISILPAATPTILSPGSAARKPPGGLLPSFTPGKGQITVETMMEILRSHEQKLGHQGPFRRSSLGSVCMHGGGLVGDHTTGSYIASLSSTLDTYWVTGSSTPCISVFKPYWMTENEILFDREQGEALHYWLFREEFHRLVLQNKVDNLDNHLRQGADLERKALDQAASLGAEAEPGKLNAIMAEFWQVEEKLVQTTVEESRWNQGNMKGSPYFRHYWKKQTKKLGF